MGNFFAYFMLALWPVIAMFITRKKAPDTALILLFLVPYLILPSTIALDLSITSSLDKYVITSLVAFLIMRSKYGPMDFLPNSFPIKVLILMLVTSPFLTFLYNRDPVFLPSRMLPGLTVKDAINAELSNFCWMYVPFLLGFTWLGDPKSHVKLLAILAAAGLAYSLPMLWEVRMSPQLNMKFYGFFPGAFDQQFREGGFRPVVFLEHGLRVAVFFSMSIMAVMAMHKSVEKDKKTASKSRLKLLYMLAVMFLCKTWSALIYTAVAMALIFATKPKIWVRFSVVIITLVFVFPFVRNSSWMPVDKISGFFSQYNADRGGSLQYRFDNEDILLDKANERPLAGWGGWGRSRVYNALGQDVSVTDGTWIIVYGVTGWIGYLAEFGLILFPVLLASRKLCGNQVMAIPISTAAIFIILAFKLIDLIPNSSLIPFNYLLSGALMGYAKLKAHSYQAVRVEAKPFVQFRDLFQ